MQEHPNSKLLIEYLRHNPKPLTKGELYSALFNGVSLPNRKRGEPYAAVIAFKDANGVIQYKWSQCNETTPNTDQTGKVTKPDRFNKKKAIDLALNDGHDDKAQVPPRIQEALASLKERAEKYFLKNESK